MLLLLTFNDELVHACPFIMLTFNVLCDSFSSVLEVYLSLILVDLVHDKLLMSVMLYLFCLAHIVQYRSNRSREKEVTTTKRLEYEKCIALVPL